jgi:hypothetical protein
MAKKRGPADDQKRGGEGTPLSLSTAQLAGRDGREVAEALTPRAAVKLRGFGARDGAHRPRSRVRAVGRRTRRGLGQHG